MSSVVPLNEVSLFTSAYNVGRFSGKGAASILGQDVKNWKWIVVDDGSSDDTADRINAIDHDRITLIRQKNRGVTAARYAAHATYFTFMDVDNRMPRGSLSQRISFLQRHPDVDSLKGGILKFGQTAGGTYSGQLDRIADAIGSKVYPIS